jgi:hypothetical protein
VTDRSATATAALPPLARRRACPPLTLTALLGDRGDGEDGNEPGEQDESSHGSLQESRDIKAFLYFLRGFRGTNARKRRGLSTMMRCSTSSFTPAAFSFGRNTVSVFA